MRYRKESLFVMRPLLVYIPLGIFLMVFGLALAHMFLDDPNSGWIGSLVFLLMFVIPGFLFVVYVAVRRIFVLPDRLISRSLFGISRTIFLNEVVAALTTGEREVKLYRNGGCVLHLGLYRGAAMMTKADLLMRHLQAQGVPVGLENREKTGIVRSPRTQPQPDWEFAADGSAVRSDAFVIRLSKVWGLFAIFFCLILAGSIWALTARAYTNAVERIQLIAAVPIAIFCGIGFLLMVFRRRTVVERDRFTVVTALKAPRTYHFSEISRIQQENDQDSGYIRVFVNEKAVLRLSASERGGGEFIQLVQDYWRAMEP